MFIMRNKETGDVMGPYQTKKLAIQYGPKGEQWEPESIGKRTPEGYSLSHLRKRYFFQSSSSGSGAG